MSSFFHFQLRTSDVGAARAFYESVLGGGASLEIVQLSEQAVARGARPQWLGFLDVGEVGGVGGVGGVGDAGEVGDVDRAADSFARRGAMALGAKWVDSTGLEAAVMRDPGGAIVALARPPVSAQERRNAPSVVWHLLNTADVERAKADYGELFGWHFKAPVDLESLGVFHPFSWGRDGRLVGSMSDIRARPGVHPHWLFHWRVAALEPVLEVVRAGGGVVVGPVCLPTGERFAICDDPQGATFALVKTPNAGRL